MNKLIIGLGSGLLLFILAMVLPSWAYSPPKIDIAQSEYDYAVDHYNEIAILAIEAKINLLKKEKELAKVKTKKAIDENNIDEVSRLTVKINNIDVELARFDGNIILNFVQAQ